MEVTLTYPPPHLSLRRALIHFRDRYQFPYMLVLPAVAMAVAVSFYPILYAIDLSVHDTRFLEKGRFIGGDHFTRFFSEPKGWENLRNSVVLVLWSLALAMPIGLGLALLLNLQIRFRWFFRMILIVPWVISPIITAMLWSWILNPQYGIIRFATDALGYPAVDLLGTIDTAMATVIGINVWRSFPFAMLLLLAALQTVPSVLIEAARIDGANAWHRFWYITFPNIRSTILVVSIMLSLSYFNHIDLPFILTGGGPLGATEILSLRVYLEAFEFNRMGFGSAIAIIVFIVNIVLSLIYIRILRGER